MILNLLCFAFVFLPPSVFVSGDCPELSCHDQNLCPFGYTQDDDGCETCECLLDQCESITCLNRERCYLTRSGAGCFPCKKKRCHRSGSCLLGYELDGDNCPSCDCIEWCPEVNCPEGYVCVSNENGKLSCKDPCEEVNCPEGYVCVSNENGKLSCEDSCDGVTCDDIAKNPNPDVAFTKVPENKMVNEYDTFFLACDTNQDPPIKLEWKFNGGPLPKTPNIDVNKLGLTLSVSRVLAELAGIYTCVAKGDFGEISADATISVVPAVPAHIVDNSPSEVTVDSGTGVTLFCDAEGDPKPTVRWFKDGYEVFTKEEDGVKRYCDGRLEIERAFICHEGEYTCVASNPAGKAKHTTSLTVKDNNVEHPDDAMIEDALNKMTYEVEKAMEMTEKEQDDPRKSLQAHDLHNLFRYPDPMARKKGSASDIMELALEYIRTEVDPDGTKGVSHQDLLSPRLLHKVAALAGCLEDDEMDTNKLCADFSFHSRFRTINGTCNNLKNPLWGAARTTLKRLLPAEYDNAISFPKGWNPKILYNGFPLPSAREVSGKMCSALETTDDDDLSVLLMAWGQWIDHDLDLTPNAVSNIGYSSGVRCSETCAFIPPCFGIKVPENDSRIRTKECLPFTRSSAACSIDKSNKLLKNREQINEITSYIDANMVYGSTNEVADLLRDFESDKGLLKVGVTLEEGAKPLLPPSSGKPIDCGNIDPNSNNVPCFLAGDVRANEFLGLLVLHTLFMREHNRVALILGELNPHWDGERIYQEARLIVGAETQQINYNEYLPPLYGSTFDKFIGDYEGYDPLLDGGIANSFSTAAFRLHSEIPDAFFRLDCTFNEIEDGNLPMHKSLFAPQRIVEEGGIDPITRGMYGRPSKLGEPSQQLTQEMTEHLFTLAKSVAFDLASLNIQRGRDHGLPGYNKFRGICGLKEAETFADFSDEIQNPEVLKKLEDLYGHVDNVDVWPGMLSEENLPGGKLGPVFACIIGEQFKRTRAADRFWFENPGGVFTTAQMQELRQANLARVICDNSNSIEHIQLEPLRVATFPNEMVTCDSEEIKYIDLRHWKEFK